MNRTVISSPDFSIRSPQTPAEIETFFQLNAQAFRADEDQDFVATQRRRYITQEPDFRTSQLRGAYLGTSYVGGYSLLERTMCFGPTRLLTGCISGVVTHPDYRHQGIASVLMQDAISFAQGQHYALLFLHGLPGFYYQFGYTDVLEDIPWHYIDRELIPEQSSEAYAIRSATGGDALAILTLYQRHFNDYLGSFAPTRTIQRQEHLLRNWFEVNETKPLLVLNPRHELHGYLMLSRRQNRLYTYEVVAETWPATLALLQYHSHLLDEEAEPPGELWWALPPTDSTFYLLADHLPVRSELISYPNRGWMARPAHLPTLLQSLLPLWQEYWRQRPCTLNWSGTLLLSIDDYTCLLEIEPANLRFVDKASSSPQHVILNQQLFTQLIFGFRPISWIITQPGQQIPAELVSLLNVLFPYKQTWVAGSDFF